MLINNDTYQREPYQSDPFDNPYGVRHVRLIKWNESDVGNIDFELQAKRGDKFLSFTLFLN